MYNVDEVAKIFKALCDPTRVKIIQYLKNGDCCACKITDDLDIAQSKLSYHMKILCDSGIVENWYVGKWTHYKLSENGAVNAIDLLNQVLR